MRIRRAKIGVEFQNNCQNFEAYRSYQEGSDSVIKLDPVISHISDI